MPLLARCHPCGKTYRVPHPDRLWTCKECGEPLVTTEDEVQKHDVSADLHEGFRCLKRLELITTVNLVCSGVLALLLVGMALLDLDPGKTRSVLEFDLEGESTGQWPHRVRLVVAAVGVLLIGLAWLAKTLLFRAPVPVLAAMTLASGGLAWWTGQQGDLRLESVVWCAFLGYATWQAFQFQGLLRAHPDSFVARRLRRGNPSPVLPGLVVGAAVLLGLSSFFVSDGGGGVPNLNAMPERHREPGLVEVGTGQTKLALESFLEAWNEADFARLASMGSTKTARKNLAELQTHSALPRLEDVTYEEGPDWL